MASQQQSRRHREEEDSISTRSPQLLQPANVGDSCGLSGAEFCERRPAEAQFWAKAGAARRALDHRQAVGYVGYFRRRIGTGQGMKQIPSVADGLLQGTAAGGAAGLAVGSPGWFAWLADDAVRSFSFRSPAGAYTVRKERRRRGGAYWVAYRTAAGRQHKVSPGIFWPGWWRCRWAGPGRVRPGLGGGAAVRTGSGRGRGWCPGFRPLGGAGGAGGRVSRPSGCCRGPGSGPGRPGWRGSWRRSGPGRPGAAGP
jgi:hypothetical protein